MNNTELYREEAVYDRAPDFTAVYVIEDETLGFLCTFQSHSMVACWCATLEGAMKFDSFKDITARTRALSLRDYYSRDAKVWAYPRHIIYPELYKKKEV